MSKYKGIDVSLFQGTPDFKKVKNGGIDFVMIKASQGRMNGYNKPFTDPRFQYNIVNADESGLFCGVYHYLCASNEAQVREEAEYFISTIKPFRWKVRMWAAVDVEDSTFITTDKAATTKNVKLFCDLIREAGFTPMVYANTYWLNTRFDAPSGVPIWEANLSVKEKPGRAAMWQYSFTGKVDGIQGDVDLNTADCIIGDVNGDGRLDTKDIMQIMRYVAGWSGVSLNETKADVNKDGYVNTDDVLKLMQHIAGRGL